MHTHVATLPYLPAVQWRRVSATAATIAVHLLAGVLLLAPLAPPLRQPTVAPDTVVVNMVEAQPKKEIPPPLDVPVIKHVQPIHPPQPILPTPTVVDNPEPTIMSIPAVPGIPTGPAELPASSGKTESAGYRGSTRVTYPREALRAREQGKVILHVMVDAEGLPQTIEIAKSSGSPRLDRAAREAVLHWHFVAAIENGKTIASWVQVPIAFNLSDQ
ncbi:energy transducer TonB [Pseudolysobacter antarcticus]|uniref:Energy transducer TonB n=1 Tax=Pseudolysobacter antarcticus TaxID=2511995 RepID=A0A411HNF7_9GAMM|nr:energy transducer TonB [Pseudolysobacter antarcticus]QBB72019.1 energy transducer TonB [Pseudolysobacter antarcticus]